MAKAKKKVLRDAEWEQSLPPPEQWDDVLTAPEQRTVGIHKLLKAVGRIEADTKALRAELLVTPEEQKLAKQKVCKHKHWRPLGTGRSRYWPGFVMSWHFRCLDCESLVVYAPRRLPRCLKKILRACGVTNFEKSNWPEVDMLGEGTHPLTATEADILHRNK